MFIVVQEPHFPLLHKSDFPPNQGRPVGCGLHGMDLFVNKCFIDVAFRALEEENSKLVSMMMLMLLLLKACKGRFQNRFSGFCPLRGGVTPPFR